MYRYPDHAGRLRPGAKIAFLGGLLALELLCAAPADAGKPEAVDFPAIVSEFQQICGELEEARTGLRNGTLSNEEFADRVLDLFVRADSLHLCVPRGGWSRSGPNAATTFALSRALRYLIESLRENYVGIAAGDGVNFVVADRAYQAAVAWRPSVEAATATAARRN
ncbi:MAG TPA: hypothetical protein VFU59_13055 [Candidatus Eisenbacteria bacterium]|nr:hypothetical protein [Candidatus Eisenbacteria bacterium]